MIFFQFYKLSINKRSLCPITPIFHLKKMIAPPCTLKLFY